MEARLQTWDDDADPLAVIGFLLGAWAWWETGLVLYAVGAVLMLANLPVTLLAIMPKNNCLMAMKTATPETRQLIVKWGGLHAIRTALGFGGVITFLLAPHI